jgi:hypothetical protein
LNESGGSNISIPELRFALPAAFTLAEAGKTIEERRAGRYLDIMRPSVLHHPCRLFILHSGSPARARDAAAVNQHDQEGKEVLITLQGYLQIRAVGLGFFLHREDCLGVKRYYRNSQRRRCSCRYFKTGRSFESSLVSLDVTKVA